MTPLFLPVLHWFHLREIASKHLQKPFDQRFLAGRFDRVDPRVGQGLIKDTQAGILGLELEDVPILGHRLLQLARVKPVPLAFRTAIDHQVGPASPARTQPIAIVEHDAVRFQRRSFFLSE